MLSCWHDLLFLFCLLLLYLFLPSTGWLCGVGVFGLIECAHSLPALHSGLQNNNNNNNNNKCSLSPQNSVVGRSKGKVFYGQEPPSGESTTTECGVNFQLLAVITEAAQWGTPSCSQPQPATDN